MYNKWLSLISLIQIYLHLSREKIKIIRDYDQMKILDGTIIIFLNSKMLMIKKLAKKIKDGLDLNGEI